MKVPRPSGGRRILARALLYGCVFTAIVATREHLRAGDGPLTKSLGSAFNQGLSAVAKLGLGVSLLHDREGNSDSWLSRNSRKLEKVSREAFVSSAKVDIYAD